MHTKKFLGTEEKDGWETRNCSVPDRQEQGANTPRRFLTSAVSAQRKTLTIRSFSFSKLLFVVFKISRKN